jgi:hypothetical protein
LHLIFEAGEIAEEVADGLDLFMQGSQPVMMGDDAPRPLPDALLRIQLGRVGRLSLQHKPFTRLADDLLDKSSTVLGSPVMDD